MSIASEGITSGINAGPAVPGRLGLAQRQSIGHTIARLPLLALQLLGLWGFELTGTWAVKAAQLPIPGNLVGMVGLYLLLSFGLVKVSWFDVTGSFLIKHLAFFFIPITVGLMDAGHLLAVHGLGIALTLVVSAGAGILVSGFVAQSLASSASPAGEGQ